MSAPFPFRTDALSATPDEVERENRRVGLAGGRHAFLPLEREVEKFQRRMRDLRQPLFAHEHCITYAHHPDERALIELIRRPYLRGTYWYFFLHVYARSRNPDRWRDWGLPEDYRNNAARTNSIIPDLDIQPDAPSWDPLMDAVDEVGQWPTEETHYPVRFASWSAFARPLSVGEMLAADPRVDAWLASRPSADEWLRLESFRSPKFFCHLAERAPDIPETVLPRLFRHPETWRALLGRESPEPHVTQYVRKVAEAHVLLDAEGLTLESVFEHPRHRLHAHDLLRTLRSPESPLVERTRKALWDRTQSHLREDGRLSEGAPAEIWTTYAGDPAIPPSEMEAVYEYLSGLSVDVRVQTLAAFIQSPSAGPALWRRIAAEQRSPRIRLLLASHHPSARDPEVRTRLLRVADKEVASALCETATAEEFPALLRRVVSSATLLEKAAEILEMATAERLSGLSRTDLAPLLASPDQRVRLTAIRVLSRLEQAPSAAMDHTTTRAPAR